MLIERLHNTMLPEGTKARLDRLRPQINSMLGVELNSRAALVRLILLEGIADLEGECVSLRAAIILKHRKQRERNIERT